jgi:hypothetical protein
MNYIEVNVARFRVLAKEILDEQIQVIKWHDKPVTSGNPGSLQLINSYSDALSRQLDRKIKSVIDNHGFDKINELETELNKTKAEYINEFLRTNYVKTGSYLSR